jgi:hypothetical protein
MIPLHFSVALHLLGSLSSYYLALATVACLPSTRDFPEYEDIIQTHKICN